MHPILERSEILDIYERAGYTNTATLIRSSMSDDLIKVAISRSSPTIFTTSPDNDKDKSGVQPKQAARIGLVLDLLEAAAKPEDVNFPGSDFHRLKGNRKDVYSVHVNGNWTITFQFKNGDAYDVDLEDYH